MNRHSPGSEKDVISPGAVDKKRPAAMSVFLFSAAMFAVGFPQLAFGEIKGEMVDPKVSVLKGVPLPGTPTIEEFQIPTPYSSPHGIVIDKKDQIWFTEMAGNNIAVFNPVSRVLKEYRIPSTKDLPESSWKYDPSNKTAPQDATNIYSVGSPGNLTIDKDGIVWAVVLLGNSILRFDPEKEEFTEFLLPTKNAQPYDIAADSRGRIWFIEKNAAQFGYIDTSSKKVIEISLGAGANPMGLVIDGQDHIWIGDVSGNYIGEYNPATKEFKKNDIYTQTAQPGQMRFDKTGKLWICHLHKKQLGVFITAKEIFSVVDMPGYNAVPQAIAISADDKIWIVDSMMNRVGYFDQISLKWNIFEIASANTQPMGVAIDSKGDVWFTESDRMSNKIARLVQSTVSTIGGVSPKAGAEEGLQKMADAEEKEKETWFYKYGATVITVLIMLIGAYIMLKSPKQKD